MLPFPETRNTWRPRSKSLIFRLETSLRRIPVAGDHFEYASWRFEVMDMDKNRVDKVLIARTAPAPTDPADLTLT